MKLYTLYTKTHERLIENWFLPTLPDEFELQLVKGVSTGGNFRTINFKNAVIEKCDMIIAAIQENSGKAFVYADCDIQFFKPMMAFLEEQSQHYDFVCQRDDPWGNVCSGFFVARGSERVLRLWKRVRQCTMREGQDQIAFNRNLGKSMRVGDHMFRVFNRCSYAFLPDAFFGGGTLSGKLWTPGMALPIPKDIVLHHANWTVGVDNKIAQLQYVRDVVNSWDQGRGS